MTATPTRQVTMTTPRRTIIVRSTEHSLSGRGSGAVQGRGVDSHRSAREGSASSRRPRLVDMVNMPPNG
jgi:hypothetical protein